MRIRVVAGEYDDIRGPVTEIAAQPIYMDVTLEPGEEIRSARPPARHTAIAYVFEGAGLFGLDENDQGQSIEAVAHGRL